MPNSSDTPSIASCDNSHELHGDYRDSVCAWESTESQVWSTGNLCYALICANGVALRDRWTLDGRPAKLWFISFGMQKRISLRVRKTVEVIQFMPSKFEFKRILALRLDEP